MEGKFDKAGKLCSSAIDILENVFDRDHPAVAEVLKTMMQLHYALGEETRAQELAQRIEEIRTRSMTALAPVASAD